MAERHKVTTLSQLKAAQSLEAAVDGQPLALFLVEDRVFATTGKCPHAGGPLHQGSVCDGMLSCPWHGWTYNLETGACEESDDIVLTRYEVEVQGDDVYVQL